MSKAIRRARQMGILWKLDFFNYPSNEIFFLGILPYMYRPKVYAVKDQ